MEAQGKATLALSANSSSIAAWDAKLGFQKTTYIATLRSLSPEGGVAKLLDLTVVKLYPIGFTRPGEEGWAEGPWNVKEEALKQAAWEVDSISHEELFQNETNIYALPRP